MNINSVKKKNNIIPQYMENKTDDELKWKINIRDERNYWINQLIEKFLKSQKMFKLFKNKFKSNKK